MKGWRQSWELVAGILLALGAVFFWFHFVGHPFDDLSLLLRSQTAAGTVIEAEEVVDDDSNGRAVWSHHVTYRYIVPDKGEFRGTTGSLPGRLREDMRAMTEPVAVAVEYLPDHPGISRIKGSGCSSVFEWVWRKALLGLFLLVLFLAPGMICLRLGWKALRHSMAGNATAEGGRDT